MDVKCSVGQKTSRVINKVCHQFGVDLHESYNARFAELADELNPLELPRTAVLSVHPCDYLEMSNVSNPWSSCHNLEDGCYKAGTLSYMLDTSTLIFYTTNRELYGLLYEAPKITREVFCYAPGVLLQSRLYPNCEDSESRACYRALVQSAMAKCEGVPNLWSLKTDPDCVAEYITTQEDSSHYPDYANEEYYANISILKGVDFGSNSILIGAPARCLSCYSIVYEHDSLFCEDCSDERRCDSCGDVVDSDDLYYVDGGHYCSNCVSHCDMCEEYFLSSMNVVTDADGDHIYMCDSCLQEHADICSACGEYFVRDALTLLDEERLCSHCLAKVEASVSA